MSNLEKTKTALTIGVNHKWGDGDYTACFEAALIELEVWNTRAKPTITDDMVERAWQAAADWVSTTFPDGGEKYPHYPMIKAVLQAALGGE